MKEEIAKDLALHSDNLFGSIIELAKINEGIENALKEVSKSDQKALNNCKAKITESIKALNGVKSILNNLTDGISVLDIENDNPVEQTQQSGNADMMSVLGDIPLEEGWTESHHIRGRGVRFHYSGDLTSFKFLLNDHESLSQIVIDLVNNSQVVIMLKKLFPDIYKYLSRKFVKSDFNSEENFLEYIDNEISNPNEAIKKYLDILYSDFDTFKDIFLLGIYKDAREYNASDLKRLLGDDALHYVDENHGVLEKLIKNLSKRLGVEYSNPDEEEEEEESEPEEPKYSGLCVFLPSGDVINNDTARETFVEAILSAGLHKVKALGYTFASHDLISKTLSEKYANTQIKVAGGWYIITHSNNKDKKKMLEKISNALDLGWRVENFEK